jgi:hypothetical protein
MRIESFRPDFVVIDSFLGTERSVTLARQLSEDPRVPLVRVILTGKRKKLPRKLQKTVYAYFSTRLSASIISDIVTGSFPNYRSERNSADN